MALFNLGPRAVYRAPTAKGQSVPLFTRDWNRLTMPLLSTVPQKSGTADVQKCLPTLSDKASAKKTNGDTGMILSTEEIKVPAGPNQGEVTISVPRFGGSKLGAPPGLETNFSKPPGIHFAPPPGLSRQPMKVTEPDSSSMSGLPAPPFPTTSPALVSPSSSDVDLQDLPEEKEATCLSDGDNSTVDDEQQVQAETDAIHPLPTLLGSTPLPSLLSSAPLYGKSIKDKFKFAKTTNKVEKSEPALEAVPQ